MDEETDGHDEAKSNFRNFANAPSRGTETQKERRENNEQKEEWGEKKKDKSEKVRNRNLET